MFVKLAKDLHIAEILEIYTPYIAGSTVTFESEKPTIAQFEQRLKGYKQYFPWLVAEEGGSVAGYAYASRYRDRAAYQWVAEVSIYLHQDFKGKGIARTLYRALFDILKLQGIKKLYAVITIPNKESVGFHEKMGFKWFATFKNVGYKQGKWCDVGWWELPLKESVDAPANPIWFPDLDNNKIDAILQQYAQ